MKRLLALAAAAALLVGLPTVAAPPAGATHIRANGISWHRTGTTQAEFHVSGAWRWSYYGRPPVGDQVSESWFSFGDGTSTNPPFTVTFVDPVNDLFIADAHFAHDYGSAPGPFTASLSNCCRLSRPLHRNNPDGDLKLQSLVDLAGTSAGPVSQISPVVDCPTDSVCRFRVPATDADNQGLAWRLASSTESGGLVNPAGATVGSSTGIYEWDTTGADLNSNGESFFSTQVIIENLVGQSVVASTPVDFFIRVTDTPNRAPEFDGPTPADGAVLAASPGVEVSFDVSATDADTSDTVNLAVLGLPGDASFTTTPGNPATGTFSWHPTATGQSILTLLAQDQSGLGAVQRSVTIDVVNRPNAAPSFVAPTPPEGTPVTGHRGTAIDIPLAATDPDGDPLTFSQTSGPAGSEVITSGTTPVLRVTPAVLGDAALTVEVSDGRGGTAVRNLILRATNRAPEFDAQTPPGGSRLPAVATGLVELTISATDPDNPDSIALGTLGLPPGATYTYVATPGRTASAVFRWQPPVVGSFPVTFTVHDATGASATYRTLTLDVTRAPTALEVNPSVLRVSTSPVSVVNGQLVNNDAYVLFASAYLRTGPGSPVPGLALFGHRVKFFAGSTFLCEGITRADGMAFCQGNLADRHVQTVLNGGYSARFAGDQTFAETTGVGAVVKPPAV
jgi:hypothetical protein